MRAWCVCVVRAWCVFECVVRAWFVCVVGACVVCVCWCVRGLCVSWCVRGLCVLVRAWFECVLVRAWFMCVLVRAWFVCVCFADAQPCGARSQQPGPAPSGTCEHTHSNPQHNRCVQNVRAFAHGRRVARRRTQRCKHAWAGLSSSASRQVLGAHPRSHALRKHAHTRICTAQNHIS